MCTFPFLCLGRLKSSYRFKEKHFFFGKLRIFNLYRGRSTDCSNFPTFQYHFRSISYSMIGFLLQNRPQSQWSFYLGLKTVKSRQARSEEYDGCWIMRSRCVFDTGKWSTTLHKSFAYPNLHERHVQHVTLIY